MVLVANKPLLVNPNIVFREEEDGAFLFDPDTGNLKCLNPLGGLIWLACDGTRPLAEIEQELVDRYPQALPETVKSELREFLEELFDLGYLGYQVSKGG